MTNPRVYTVQELTDPDFKGTQKIFLHCGECQSRHSHPSAGVPVISTMFSDMRIVVVPCVVHMKDYLNGVYELLDPEQDYQDVLPIFRTEIRTEIENQPPELPLKWKIP